MTVSFLERSLEFHFIVLELMPFLTVLRLIAPPAGSKVKYFQIVSGGGLRSVVFVSEPFKFKFVSSKFHHLMTLGSSNISFHVQ